MNRTPPSASSDEIDVYVRTYTSLLRSSGDVPVRAFEEAHAYSNSSLHAGARDARADVAAFAYSAARLPACMLKVTHVVMGQSHEQFEAAGMNVSEWARVVTRGRRRPLRWDGKGTLAAFVTSTSDIDDLVPILTAYQIEWNKMHDLITRIDGTRDFADAEKLAAMLDIDVSSVDMLTAALGNAWQEGLKEIAERHADLSVRLLNGSFAQYQRAALRWWSGIEPVYMRKAHPRRPPVYFVSSNTHSLANIFGGYAFAHRNEILEFAQKRNPEGLGEPLRRALSEGDEHSAANLAYYLLRAFLHDPEGNPEERLASVQRFDAESGLRSIESPGRVDVGAQLIEIGKIQQGRLDSRVRVDGIEKLAESDAIIINIDYPLGMAAYHHLSRTAQGVGEIQGVYIMGKGATLNGRIGDVMIGSVVYDEHSQNTYMYRNSFSASDVQPYLRYGTVLDNQKALTVRGTFLQNRDYVGAFYREGYTVLEMEAGPYLSAIHEIVNPARHPENEIVHLSNSTTFDTGFLHYASDTPYSRRQSLLSKSLSYFGVESTYACSIAIVRRIFENEIKRLSNPR